MKPNFALILSMDGIALLQRSSPGWALVGEAYPDDPDLGAKMTALREAANRLAPGAATFKVVVPNDQIRFLTIPAGAKDVDKAVAEAFRVLKPGGKLVVLELAPHREAWLREALGDRHLGLEASDVVRAFRQAGFEGVSIETVDDAYQPRAEDEADPVSLPLYLVHGRAPA